MSGHGVATITVVSVIRVSGQWWVLAHCSQSDHVASQPEGSSCTTATNGFKKSLDLARTLMRAAPQPNSPCLSAPHTRGHVTGNGNVQDKTGSVFRPRDMLLLVSQQRSFGRPHVHP